MKCLSVSGWLTALTVSLWWWWLWQWWYIYYIHNMYITMMKCLSVSNCPDCVTMMVIILTVMMIMMVKMVIMMKIIRRKERGDRSLKFPKYTPVHIRVHWRMICPFFFINFQSPCFHIFTRACHKRKSYLFEVKNLPQVWKWGFHRAPIFALFTGTIKFVDEDDHDNIYIMMKCVSLCQSQKNLCQSRRMSIFSMKEIWKQYQRN